MRYCSAADTARPRPRLLITMLMFALPMLLGNWAMLVRYRVDLQWESHQAASHTLALMETMLSHAQAANRQALPFLGMPCATALPTLRSLVAMVPFVRSVNLSQGDSVYCTSQFGRRRIPYTAEQYSQGQLRLMEGNEVRRHHPVLSVRTGTVQGAVMTLIDGDYLNFMLSLNQGAMPLMLRVGDGWLDEEGHFFAATPSLASQEHVELQAAGYPLSIYAGYSSAPTLMGLWRHHGFGIWLLFAFSAGVAVLMWWLLGRPRSPTSELARALRAKEFVPYLQPLVESGSERIMGVEVLMRWQHPDVGLIRPDLFIPQAEACGLIVPMTSLIMGRVGQRLAAEQRRLPDESPAQVLEAARGVTAAAVLSDELGCQAVPCLEAVLTAYRQMRLMQNLRSQACAVPKATVGLLSALPAVTVALGELLGARPLAFLLGSPRGVVCLVLGGCCYAAGLAWMRALLKGSGL